MIQFTIIYGDNREFESETLTHEGDSIAGLRAAASDWLDKNGITGPYAIRFE